MLDIKKISVARPLYPLTFAHDVLKHPVGGFYLSTEEHYHRSSSFLKNADQLFLKESKVDLTPFTKILPENIEVNSSPLSREDL